MLEAALGSINARFATDESLVHFDRAAIAAHGRRADGAHGLADAVEHEPRRLVGDAEHAVQQVGADALLAGTKQMSSQQPLVKRDLAALEHRADRHAILLPTVVALDNTLAKRAFRMSLSRTATLRREPLCTERAAMRAKRTLRPAQGLKMLAGLVLVREVRSGKVRHTL